MGGGTPPNNTMAELGATLRITVEFVLEQCFPGYSPDEALPLVRELTRAMASRWYAAWSRHLRRSTRPVGCKTTISLPSRDATELVRSWMPWALQSLRDDLDTGLSEAEIAPGRDAEVLVDVV